MSKQSKVDTGLEEAFEPESVTSLDSCAELRATGQHRGTVIGEGSQSTAWTGPDMAVIKTTCPSLP